MKQRTNEDSRQYSERICDENQVPSSIREDVIKRLVRMLVDRHVLESIESGRLKIKAHRRSYVISE